MNGGRPDRGSVSKRIANGRGLPAPRFPGFTLTQRDFALGQVFIGGFFGDFACGYDLLLYGKVSDLANSSIRLNENGLHLLLEITEERDVRLLHFGAVPFDESTVRDGQKAGFRLLELQLSGEDRAEYHGRTHRATYPGLRMRYETHRDSRTEPGRKLEVELRDPATGLKAVQHFQFYDGVQTARCWATLANEGEAEADVEYVSSFALTGLDKEGERDRDEKMVLTLAHNGWQSELQWRSYTLPELGLSHLIDRTSKRVSCSNTGSWSASEHLPMAVLENREAGTSLFWQIEHNGSWHWEIIDQVDRLTLLASGPTEHDNHWWVRLRPGQQFASVPVAVGAVAGGFEEAIGQLTAYRRKIRRPNADNRELRIIFNDYMNCLWGDPTTAKLLPLIDAAAEAGCEYFCIDAGWYAVGEWWDGVGEWLPSSERFPGRDQICARLHPFQGHGSGLVAGARGHGDQQSQACRDGRRLVFQTARQTRQRPQPLSA